MDLPSCQRERGLIEAGALQAALESGGGCRRRLKGDSTNAASLGSELMWLSADGFLLQLSMVSAR